MTYLDLTTEGTELTEEGKNELPFFASPCTP